jgi:hypothetical protein
MGDISIQIKNLEYKNHKMLTKENENILNGEKQIIHDQKNLKRTQKELYGLKETSNGKLSGLSTYSHHKSKSCDFAVVKCTTYSKRIKALKMEEGMIQIQIIKINEYEKVKHQVAEIDKEITTLKNKLDAHAFSCKNSFKDTNIKNLETKFEKENTELKEEIKLSIEENNLKSRQNRTNKSFNKYYSNVSKNDQYPIVIPKLKFDKIINRFNSKI